MKYLFLIAALFLSGCGSSPLLHHSNSKSSLISQVQTTGQNSQTALRCDIHFEQTDICAQLNWAQVPEAEVENHFTLTFFNTQGTLEPQSAPQIKLVMVGMPHGAPAVTVQKTETATYSVTHVTFTMPGDWEMHIRIGNEEAVYSISL